VPTAGNPQLGPVPRPKLRHYRYAKEVVAKLNAFASQYSIPFAGVVEPQNLGDVDALVSNFPKSLQQLRSQHPILEDQGSLLTARTRLEGVKKGYDNQLSAVAEAEKAIGALPPEKRDIARMERTGAELDGQIAKLTKQIHEVSANAALLDKALGYFQSRAPSENSVPCPICGQTSKNIGEWEEHLRLEIEHAHTLPLQTKKGELERAKSDANRDKRNLLVLNAKLERERQSLLRIKYEVEAALGAKLKETDDPGAVLAVKIAEVAETLKSLQSQVEEINSQLQAFQDSGRILDGVVRIGKTRGEISQIEGIQTSQAYKPELWIRYSSAHETNPGSVTRLGVVSATPKLWEVNDMLRKRAVLTWGGCPWG